MSKKIGQRLESERVDRLKFTQREVAPHLEVTERTYANYEGGSTKLPAEKLAKLATLGIGADLLYILLGERALYAMSENEQTLLARFRMLKEEEQKRVFNMIEHMQTPQTGTHIYGAIGQYVTGNGQYFAGDVRVPFTVNVGNSEKKSEE